MKHKPVVIGILLTLVLLTIHILRIDDYGVTWDFYHHLFAGFYLMGRQIGPELTEYIPFTIPDPRGTYALPFGPLMSIAPAASYIVFFEKLKVLAFDNAYNLSIIGSGVFGILFLYLFLLEATGWHTALFGFLFLALFPRYFGDLHNNMKDVPQAAMFTLAIWMYWRLLNRRRPKDLVLAAASFAIAFNTKVNTLMVPVIAMLWTLVVLATRLRRQLTRPLVRRSASRLAPIVSYFVFAPLAAFALWSYFWPDPVGHLKYLVEFFQYNTINIEVLYFGTIYRSAVNVPWHYPFGYLAITTPLPMLAAVLIGVVVLVKKVRSDPLSSLLLLWFFVPLARYLHPKVGVIDGIRHFEEVVFPLSAIAAIGLVAVLRFIMKTAVHPSSGLATFSMQRRTVKRLLISAVIGIFGFLAQQLIVYHPYQITYFNELVGGVRGALGRFDIEYWGTSQKQAIRFLNRYAKKDAAVHIVMAGDVAALYLRPDLRRNVNTRWFDDSDYVVVLNRQSFFFRYYGLSEYMERRKLLHTVTVGTVPLTLVYDNSQEESPVLNPWWLTPL